jgi:hypothetical protein
MEANEPNADGFVTLEFDDLWSEERRTPGARYRRRAWAKSWKRKL